jgi:hypothetical protein
MTSQPRPPFPSDYFKRIQGLWQSAQVDFSSFNRWGTYTERNPDLRVQTCGEHVLGIQVLAEIMIPLFARFYPSLDVSLLRQTILVHDMGEMCLKRDVPNGLKEHSHDIQEAHAFRELLVDVPPEVMLMWSDAFFLQFCLGEQEGHSEIDQTVMQRLAVTKRTEALVFDAIERWDYFQYIVECFLDHDDEFMLVHTMQRELEPFERLRRELSGFREFFCTDEIVEWYQKILLDTDVVLDPAYL